MEGISASWPEEKPRPDPTRVQHVAIVDTETTGVDPESDQVIEVACVLWNVRHACTVDVYSGLVFAEENPAEHINNIPPELLQRTANGKTGAWDNVKDMAFRADMFLAHNAAFDKAMTRGELWTGHVPEPAWVCSMEDVKWPRESHKRDLITIALTHGVAVTSAHRALTDCLILASLLERCAEMGHNVQQMLDAALAHSLLPRYRYESLEPYERRAEVKAAGFHWDGEFKVWWRNMTEEDAAGVEGIRMRMGKRIDD